MGDRRMAEIVTEGGSLYVYSHGGGWTMDEDAEAAIRAARPRWGDSAYETRIVVDQLTKNGRDSTLGYGLMLAPNAEDKYNGDSPSIVIDLQERRLKVVNTQEPSKNSDRSFEQVAGG